MKRTRFAPSPTGSLHVGNALSAVGARRLGDWLLLRIDDTDPARNLPGGEEAILRDLDWLGVRWDEGPVRQSGRQERYPEAAAETLARFRERAQDGLDPKAIVRELKAVGGDLRALRLALTGRDRGPELWAGTEAPPREEALPRAERPPAS